MDEGSLRLQVTLSYRVYYWRTSYQMLPIKIIITISSYLILSQ